MSTPKKYSFPAVEAGDHLTFINVTPEDKERYKKLCDELFYWLQERTKSPVEALTVMMFLSDGIKETLGIRHHSLVTTPDGGTLQ